MPVTNDTTPLTVDELEEMYGLRAVIEGFLAGRAAERMDLRAIEALAALHERFERLLRDDRTTVEALIEVNDAFHGLIVQSRGSARLGRVVEMTKIAPMSVRRDFWTSPQSRRMTSVYHREIVEAIRVRDAVRAEAVMRSHIYAAKGDFLAHWSNARADGLLEGSAA